MKIEKNEPDLHIFQTVLLTDAAQDVLLTSLLELPCQQQLIKDEVCLLEVENDVQFAHVSIILVHLFNVSVYNFECDQLVIRGIAASDEEE